MKAPEHLNKKAAAIWTVHLPLLGDRPTVLQFEQLEAFAVEKARWLDALNYLEENGSTIIIRNDKGDPKAVQEAPEVRIGERARVAWIALADRLGFGRKRTGEKKVSKTRDGKRPPGRK